MENIKKGTWINIVRDDGIIFNTLKYDGIDKPKYGYSFEAWEPKQGDYCWFYNNTAQSSCRLAIFDKIAFGKGREGQYRDKQGKYFTKCEPFINDYPSFIGHSGD